MRNGAQVFICLVFLLHWICLAFDTVSSLVLGNLNKRWLYLRIRRAVNVDHRSQKFMTLSFSWGRLPFALDLHESPVRQAIKSIRTLTMTFHTLITYPAASSGSSTTWIGASVLPSEICAKEACFCFRILRIMPPIFISSFLALSGMPFGFRKSCAARKNGASISVLVVPLIAGVD